MFLIIDEQYRVYQTGILSGRIRTLGRQGLVSIINTKTMQGMNSVMVKEVAEETDYAQWQNELPEWSDVQNLPLGFEVDKEEE